KQLTDEMVTLDETLFTYSGGTKKPEVSVEDGGAALATSDYLLDNAGGINADNYYVTVYGTNNYTGTVTKWYIIAPKYANDDPSLIGELVGGDDIVYKGVRQAPNIRVKDDRILLEEVLDYTISYKGVDDPSYNSNMAPIAAGKYNAVVNFTRNYSGEKEVEFTINKAPLTITADDFTVVYGEDAPQYTVTYKTFQGGEDSDVLGGALAFDCLYEAGKPVGTYSITPKGFESDNYEISYFDGALTVVKADAVVVTAPTANDLIYNATEQELVVAGSAEGGVMKYSLNGNDYFEEVPTAVNAGVYSVYYKVEADGNHNDYVAPEPIAVEVKKADLTATADDFTIIYGVPAPNYTISYDGWQGSDDESVLSGDPEFACDYEQGSPVGKYVIVPSGVEANNYNIEFINGTLIVNPKSATYPDITIEQIDEEPIVYKGVRQAPNIVVKDGDKVLEEVIDYAISYTGVDPTVYDSKMAPIAAGTYNAVATMKRNYTDAIEIEFTIDPAPLTITADNFEVVYGDEAPDFTVTYKTFQGGEDPDVLEGDLAFDCSYAVGSGVGTYTITPSGLESNNYVIEYVEGTLTVVPAELAITADDKSVIYGDQAPAFTVSYDGFKAGDDESSLDGQIENTCEYAPGSFVGEYAITPSGVTSDNYNITFIDGTLTVTRAEVYVSDATVYPAKFEDGGIEAVITSHGKLNGVKLEDVVTHTVTSAVYSDAAVGEDKVITLTYALNGDADLLTNYLLKPVSEDYAEKGSIIEQIIPDNEYQSEAEATIVVNGIEIYAYGYCDGGDYSLKFHLKSGNPDQYKIVFDSDLIEDVDWTDLETPGKEGVITLALPEELPAGDYNMTVFFRDSRFDWLESDPIAASIHATVAESFVVPLFNNTIAVVDTCQCFTDIQWFYRASETEEWEALRGATGYYYHSNEKLTGEYFVRANMNGVNIYSCPQKDMDTLYGSNKNANVTVSATPNPVIDFVTISIEGSEAQNHTLKIVNMSGVEVFSTTFEGNSIKVDMTSYQKGNYVVSVDGVTAKVIKE
ncbi:MAG: T9SS type A sorting domain-containing protein, partial [Paludibacteraceae bacterium]|nr:T9SS type A sorting domain-containing protein [Paludibacteraceae bacterium]